MKNGHRHFPLSKYSDTEHLVIFRINIAASPRELQQGQENKSSVRVMHVRYVRGPGKTACAAIPSIFQHKVCCSKECNWGRPPPRALLTRPSCQQRCGLGGCSRTCCSRMLVYHPWLRQTHTHTQTNAIKSTQTHALPACINASVRLFCCACD